MFFYVDTEKIEEYGGIQKASGMQVLQKTQKLEQINQKMFGETSMGALDFMIKTFSDDVAREMKETGQYGAKLGNTMLRAARAYEETEDDVSKKKPILEEET